MRCPKKLLSSLCLFSTLWLLGGPVESSRAGAVTAPDLVDPKPVRTDCLSVLHGDSQSQPAVSEFASVFNPVSPLLQEIVFQTPSITRQKLRLESALPPGWGNRMILETSGVDERWNFLHSFPLASLIANPGHRILRKPLTAVIEIAQEITENRLPWDFEANGPALNIITDARGTLLFVDLREGHHRVLGTVKAGKTIVGELRKLEWKIFINGKLAPDFAGKWREHVVPAFGVDFAFSRHWYPFGSPETRDPGTTYQTRPDPEGLGKNKDIYVGGANSNFALGSRETVAAVIENMEEPNQPKVGVIFLAAGEGFPSPARILERITEKGLTDLVFVRRSGRFDPLELSQLAAVNRYLVQEQSVARVNAYEGMDFEEFSRKHRTETFVARIQQIFRTIHPPEVLSEE